MTFNPRPLNWRTRLDALPLRLLATGYLWVVALTATWFLFAPSAHLRQALAESSTLISVEDLGRLILVFAQTAYILTAATCLLVWMMARNLTAMWYMASLILFVTWIALNSTAIAIIFTVVAVVGVCLEGLQNGFRAQGADPHGRRGTGNADLEGAHGSA